MVTSISKKDERIVTAVWLIGIIVFWEIAAFFFQYVLNDKMAAMKLPFPHLILINST